MRFQRRMAPIFGLTEIQEMMLEVGALHAGLMTRRHSGCLLIVLFSSCKRSEQRPKARLFLKEASAGPIYIPMPDNSAFTPFALFATASLMSFAMSNVSGKEKTN